MSVECVVKSKLSDDECANRNRANQRAWDAKHVEQRRLYRLSYVRRQKQALLDSGFVPKPVGRPKRDPDTATKACVHRKRGDAYREYQKEYQKLLRARRRAEGWVSTPCGFIPPQQVEALRNYRQIHSSEQNRPAKKCCVSINTTTYSNQNGESNS